MAINARAQSGFADSTHYDNHRPSYSADVVDIILDKLRIRDQQHARIVDLAAGTGKFTAALAERPEEFEIVAVEPHSKMREVLQVKALRNVTVREGSAEDLTAAIVDDESIDGVVVAQAFHWFANLTALREIHRVLQPHGVLALVWNIEDYNAPRSHSVQAPWLSRLRDLNFAVAEEHGDQEPRFRQMQWREVFDAQLKKTPLSLLVASQDDQLFSLPIGEHAEPFVHSLTPAALWSRFSTLGHVSALNDEAKDRVHKSFLEIVSAPDVPKNEQGELAVEGNTFIYWTIKIPSEGRSGLLNVERPSA